MYMRAISKNQYDLYVFFTRNKWAWLVNEEVEWYMNESKSLWGVICLDRQDENYTVIISARDENRQIRCIDGKVDIADIEKAREWLFLQVKELEKHLVTKTNKKVVEDLFVPKVKNTKVSALFQDVANSPAHAGARNVINEMMPFFYDVDGNFVEQFQTTGFDARLWELYLFCYFNEEGLQIDRSRFAPDFWLRNESMEISLEAVTVSNKEPDIDGWELPKQEEIVEKKKYMASKWGSPLYSKFKHQDKSGKHYWEYEHTKDRPFVLAIADFHEPCAMLWSASSLIEYLYGYEYEYSYSEQGELVVQPIKIEKHLKENDGNPVPSGFFFQEGVENISAVLHSSCGTIAKFNRIGKQCGMDEENVIMLREGTVYNPDPNAAMPNRFKYIVTEENSEPFSEGVTIFHNPNARYPLPPDFFPNAAQCYFKDGYILTDSENAIVYSSVTSILIPQSQKAASDPPTAN